MFITCYSFMAPGPTDAKDHYALHDTEASAMAEYNRSIAGGADCAAVARVLHATEPHWMDDTAQEKADPTDAMAVWEAVLEDIRAPGEGPYDAYKDQHGMAALREHMAKITTTIRIAYDLACQHAGYDDSFDWEFVPWALPMLTGEDLELRDDWMGMLRRRFPEIPEAPEESHDVASATTSAQ